MIRLEGNAIHVETKTLEAVIRDGWLVSLKRGSDGAEMVPDASAGGDSALELVYRGGEVVTLDRRLYGEVSSRLLSDRVAEVRFHSYNGDGVLFITADADTGDLIVEPSAYSSRPGVLACRWKIEGFDGALDVVAPFYQGVRLPFEDTLLRETHWPWPFRWEAGLVILQGETGGMWIHTQDTRYRFKALKVGSAATARCLGLDSEAYGPIDENLSAGGVAWRINVHEGDWQVPAAAYRDWLYGAYGLEKAEAKRKPWVGDIRLALCWCPCEPEILDALAAVIDPTKVLLHLPGWRSDGYDQNYPTFRPSEKGKAFIAAAQKMGFHAMPHFNSIDMDPTHPVYPLVRDFQYRDPQTKRLQGWASYKGQYPKPPNSNLALMRNQDKNVMVKVHPGLGMWRSILAENILAAARELSLDAAFIDVTLCIWNIHRAVVDNMTPMEGMARLIDYVAGLGEGLTLGGEGLNEITAQGLSFAQQHLFGGRNTAPQDLARTGGCALNDFLFGRLCRLIGYSGLRGRDEHEVVRMRLHEQHGAIPTLTIGKAEQILQPNPAVKDLLDRATAGR